MEEGEASKEDGLVFDCVEPRLCTVCFTLEKAKAGESNHG